MESAEIGDALGGEDGDLAVEIGRAGTVGASPIGRKRAVQSGPLLISMRTRPSSSQKHCPHSFRPLRCSLRPECSSTRHSNPLLVFRAFCSLLKLGVRPTGTGRQGGAPVTLSYEQQEPFREAHFQASTPNHQPDCDASSTPVQGRRIRAPSLAAEVMQRAQSDKRQKIDLLTRLGDCTLERIGLQPCKPAWVIVANEMRLYQGSSGWSCRKMFLPLTGLCLTLLTTLKRSEQHAADFWSRIGYYPGDCAIRMFRLASHSERRGGCGDLQVGFAEPGKTRLAQAVNIGSATKSQLKPSRWAQAIGTMNELHER